MEFSLPVLIKATIALSFALFFPLTAISYFQFRLKKKRADFDDLMRTLKVGTSASKYSSPAFRNEHEGSSYILPVTFGFFVTLFGNVYLLFSQDIFAASSLDSQSALLSGMFMGSPENSHQFQMQSSVVIALALTGGFMWSAQNIIRRLMAADLTPGLYYSAGMRMTYASLIALMIFFLSKATPGSQNFLTDNMMPAMAFLIGMFPDKGLTYLKDKIALFKDDPLERAHQLPLDMVEGMSSFHKERLRENNIDNVQNLAEAKFLDLLLKTPFTARLLIDWIGQAKLLVYFKSNTNALRNYNIRDVFDLLQAGRHEGQLKQLAAKTNIDELSIQIAYQSIQENREIEILHEFQKRLVDLEDNHLEEFSGQ